MRNIYLIVLLVLTINTKVYCQAFPKGGYYRYDTLEIIKKYPYDSIRFDLHYVEISTDSIWYAVMPMFSNQPKYYSFVSDNSRFSYSKLTHAENYYYTTLIFTKDNLGKVSGLYKILEKKNIRISNFGDSVLIIDNKKLKSDNGFKIFQSFTGY